MNRKNFTFKPKRTIVNQATPQHQAGQQADARDYVINELREQRSNAEDRAAQLGAQLKMMTIHAQQQEQRGAALDEQLAAALRQLQVIELAKVADNPDVVAMVEAAAQATAAAQNDPAAQPIALVANQ